MTVSNALWYGKLTKSLESARHQPESRYIQLATVAQDGAPNVRTVVFRGFEQQSDTLYVVTDTRSEKIGELQHLPKACICWYFSRTREQYRLFSRVKIHTTNTQQELVQKHWMKMSDAGKRQFMWGEPGLPIQEGRALRVEAIPEDAPSHFCVLALDVYKVDYLTLRGNPQHREIHWRSEEGCNWQHCIVTP